MASSSDHTLPKKPRLEEDHTEALEESNDAFDDVDAYDERIQQALSDIQELHKAIEALDDEQNKELLLMDNKLKDLRKPYLDKRASSIAKIPDFWLVVFCNHPQISRLVDEVEHECLAHLTHVEVEDLNNELWFRIKFVFNENPYFKNKEIVKEIRREPNIEPISTSTPIQWKNGMDLSKEGGRMFFSWFCSNNDPGRDDIMDIFRGDICVKPQQYYNEAPEDNEAEEEVLDETEEEDVSSDENGMTYDVDNYVEEEDPGEEGEDENTGEEGEDENPGEEGEDENPGEEEEYENSGEEGEDEDL